MVPFVVDAVYAMAHALEDLRKHKCPRRRHGMCAHFLPISGEELLASIRNVSFEGIFRANELQTEMISFYYFITAVK